MRIVPLSVGVVPQLVCKMEYVSIYLVVLDPCVIRGVYSLNWEPRLHIETQHGATLVTVVTNIGPTLAKSSHTKVM